MNSDKLINNCTTVNGGIIRTINGIDVEILSHNFHNPHCNIVCYYFKEDGVKKEITYYKHLDDGLCGSELYLFKKDNVQHYYSRNFIDGTQPQKYIPIINQLKEIHNMIDFELFNTRKDIIEEQKDYLNNCMKFNIGG